MRSGSRRGATGGAVLLAVALLAACTPEPAPTPTPTGFASEAEAFAAAEATYRAYIDAVNQVNLAEPATFEPVYDTLTGDALSSAKKSFSQMHADGWVVAGSSRPTTIEPGMAADPSGAVRLAICVNVSDVTLVDSEGRSQVGERPEEQSLAAIVVTSGDAWLIQSFMGREGEPSCKS